MGSANAVLQSPMTNSESKEPLAYPTTALDRGLQLIQLVRDEGSVRVMDAADELGISRSSAHRLLQALVYRGYVVVDEDHVYGPGPALSAMLTTVSWGRDLRMTAAPHMASLVRAVGNSANLMIREGVEVRFLASSTVRGSTYDRRGAIMPARKTAGGKAMLSLLSSAQVDALYLSRQAPQQLDRQTYEKLRRQLDVARRQDFAVSYAEVEPMVSAIGTAIRSRTGANLGALTISLRDPRPPTMDVLHHSIDRLLTTREAIERDWMRRHPAE